MILEEKGNKKNEKNTGKQRNAKQNHPSNKVLW